jgi:LPS O-antigen subunit length determinant protein (WzzB/FepE family)
MENQYQEDEIDLIALVKSLWLERKFIYKTIIGFAFIGIIVSLLSPVIYTASSTFIPQTSQTRL